MNCLKDAVLNEEVFVVDIEHTALMKLPAHLPYGLQLHSPSVQLSSFLMDVLDSYP